VQGSREELSGPVVPSIVRASTFFFTGSPGETREDLYARYGNNPNQTAVARKMADLEGMEAALALGSGMAAVSMTLLALLRTGDHVVASRFLYGDTHRFVTEELSRRGISATLVNPESGREWREAMGKRTRVLFLEIPTNPALRIFDLRPMAKLAEEAGVSLVVDATFASPVNFRPAELGADVVIHSATKYLSGHSDLVAGIVSGSRGLVEEVREMLKLYGPALDPQAAWLLDRGLRTLAVRVERQNESAGALARWLQERPGVERVVYPGLESHRDHRLAREIFDGFGGILGIELSGGGKTADRFCQALEVGNAAPSLGGVETLVSQPRYTSHRGLTSAELRKAGISGSFVRISVGLEDVEDLQVDFERGLRAAAGEG
jgi:cystathionine beta-lyase/cystathionine gamma-synthase